MDGLLFLLFGDWLSVGFHGVALYFIFGGLLARNQLSALQRGQLPSTA